MHGPGGPGPGGGPHSGGPHGGPHGGFGGPYGGPGGPRGGFGPYGRHGHPYRYPGGYRKGHTLVSGGTNYLDSHYEKQADFKINSIAMAFRSKAKTKLGKNFMGFIGASRLATAGSWHYDVFKSKEESADKLFKKKQISSIVCKYRKLKAASNYFGYLFKVGRYTIDEYHYNLNAYAESIGISETVDYDAYTQVVSEEPSFLHSR